MEFLLFSVFEKILAGQYSHLTCTDASAFAYDGRIKELIHLFSACNVARNATVGVT